MARAAITKIVNVPNAFVALTGRRAWAARQAEIKARTASGPREGQAMRQRYAIELTIERLRGPQGRLQSQYIRLSGYGQLSKGAYGRGDLEYGIGNDLRGVRALLEAGYRF